MGNIKALVPQRPPVITRSEAYAKIGEFVLEELQNATEVEIIGNGFNKRDLEMIKALIKIRLHMNPCPTFVIGSYRYEKEDPEWFEWV
jgi:hypothetical protein